MAYEYMGNQLDQLAEQKSHMQQVNVRGNFWTVMMIDFLRYR